VHQIFIQYVEYQGFQVPFTELLYFHVNLSCDFVVHDRNLAAFHYYEDAVEFAKWKSTELGIPIKNLVPRNKR